VTRPTGGGRLLEREAELVRIEERIGAAREGRGSLLLLEGPAGIGKTELLGAARQLAADAGVATLAARGGDLERSFRFGVVRQLFEPRLARAKPAERRQLLAGAASLAEPALSAKRPQRALGVAGPGAGDPAASVQHGLYWLCANLAERAPLVLSIDDLHWADLASLRWLVYLARRIEGLAVLVLAATRSGEPGVDPQLLTGLTAEPSAAVLRLDALSQAASAELIGERFAGHTDAEFAAACHRVSGGNPFLLRELIEAVREDGMAPEAESVPRIEELAPETVTRSILLRLARLPEGAEPLARAVAILGLGSEMRHAAALAGLEDEPAATAADALAAASILSHGRPLRFAHPLLQAAVYEQIPESERALAHARAGRLLADEGAPVEQITAQLLHAEPAGEDWVVQALQGAARDALSRGVPEVAIAYLRRALIEPPPSSSRPELFRELVDAGLRVADFSIFREVPGDPVRELTRDRETLSGSALDLGTFLYFSGRFDEATEVIDRAIVAAIEAEDYQRAMTLEARLLSMEQFMPPEARARLERYAGRVAPGTPQERLWLAMRAWWGHFPGGSMGEATELAGQALAGGLLEEQPDMPIVILTILVLARADALDEAGTWIERVLEDARRRGSVLSFTSGIGMRAYLDRRRGDVASSAAEAREAFELSGQHGLASHPVWLAWLVDALVDLGELEEADEQITASGFGGELPDNYWFGMLRWARAGLWVAQGKVDEALSDYRHMLEVAGDTWPNAYPLASTIALALNSRNEDPEEARRLAEWELDEARKGGTPRGMGVALRALGLIEGGEAGIELLREAVETLAPSPARLEYARALADLGAALRRAKHRSEARDPLRQALELAHRCGATPLAERAREELAASGAKPRRVMLSGVESLTPSELRVARMAADGMENKAIAQALFVTVKTVETHLGHVYGKLEISSRRDLAESLGDPMP
jgi:tetratricopeptide (TPR) repeat protein